MTEWESTPWILLRGLGRDTRHWGDLPLRLREAFPLAPVMPVDLAGNGSRHGEKSPHTIAAATDDYRAHLRACGLHPPYRLLGLSMGGMVAVDWLNRHPDEVLQALAINISVGRISSPWLRLRPSALLSLLVWGGWTLAAREHWVRRFTTQLQSDPDSLERHWVALARQAHPRPGNLLRQLYAAACFHSKRPATARRLYLLVSARDRLVNPNASRQLARRWRLTLAEHPDAGHDLPLDDPQWLIDRLLDASPIASTSLRRKNPGNGGT